MTDITTSYTTHNYNSKCGPYYNRETIFLSFNSLHSYFQLLPIIFVAYTPNTAPKPACIKNLIYSKISAPANVPQPFKRLFLRWRLATGLGPPGGAYQFLVSQKCFSLQNPPTFRVDLAPAQLFQTPQEFPLI